MAGPSEFLLPRFFENSSMPFMYIGGTADAIVPYREHAQPITQKDKNSILITLDSGSHVGFIDMAPVFFRWFRNPDEFGCKALMYGLQKAQQAPRDGKPAPMLTELLGGGASGVDTTRSTAPCKAGEFAPAMRPARQHSLVILAIFSFLESQFSPSQTIRDEMHEYLFNRLAQENKDVVVSLGN